MVDEATEWVKCPSRTVETRVVSPSTGRDTSEVDTNRFTGASEAKYIFPTKDRQIRQRCGKFLNNHLMVLGCILSPKRVNPKDGNSPVLCRVELSDADFQ
jgi:hypothetical protein